MTQCLAHRVHLKSDILLLIPFDKCLLMSTTFQALYQTLDKKGRRHISCVQESHSLDLKRWKTSMDLRRDKIRVITEAQIMYNENAENGIEEGGGEGENQEWLQGGSGI